MIGTLNEGGLHAALKEWYCEPGDLREEPVDGYVVDLVRGALLIEIQTGSFAPLRRKLDALLEEHRVRLVAPVAVERRIVRLSADGEVLSARRSPSRGRLEDVFSRLVSIPTLLSRPGFEVEVLMTRQDEFRVHDPRRAYRRRGWVVCGRSLTEVTDVVRLRTPDDLRALLPGSLPDPFDTSELAVSASVDRRLAQQMTYCLRAVGVLDPAGKRGNALLHSSVNGRPAIS